jgi:hypothetical protein
MIKPAVLNEPTSRYRRPGRIVFTGLGIREIDEPIVRETWVELYIEESSLAAGKHGRYACERLG